MAYNKRTYTDAEKAEYWRQRALGNGSKSNSGSYSKGGTKATKKRSGAKFTRYANRDGVERFLTSGWRLIKGKDFITIKCVTTDKSVESEKGWLGSIACSIVNKDTGVKSFHWGTMEKKTGKVVINDLSMVINPRAKNGGYAGTFINKG